MTNLSQKLVGLAVVTALVSGCSTRPRNFAANLSAPVESRSEFETTYRTCLTMVQSGQKSGFKNAAVKIGAGAGVVGAGLAVGGAASAGAVGTGWAGIGAGAGTALAAATVFVGAAGFGMTRLIRGGRERKFKRNMSSCLGEFGYTVESWDKLKRKQDAASIAASRANLSTNPVSRAENEAATQIPVSSVGP